LLFAHGFTGLLVLKGGTKAWEEAGYPMVNGDQP
jgi:rhodanese-related sulfurtransferase